MGYPTKVQLICRKESQQWYVNLPKPVADAMNFAKGEVVEWTIEDRQHLILKRRLVPPSRLPAKRKNL
jgi:bifunctional DNA-binding transcriptional regulator/antitoxin component of YhaV-PrlF toxin-antitoxin module